MDIDTGFKFSRALSGTHIVSITIR